MEGESHRGVSLPILLKSGPRWRVQYEACGQCTRAWPHPARASDPKRCPKNGPANTQRERRVGEAWASNRSRIQAAAVPVGSFEIQTRLAPFLTDMGRILSPQLEICIGAPVLAPGSIPSEKAGGLASWRVEEPQPGGWQLDGLSRGSTEARAHTLPYPVDSSQIKIRRRQRKKKFFFPAS